jgi:hypothetical protein
LAEQGLQPFGRAKKYHNGKGRGVADDGKGVDPVAAETVKQGVIHANCRNRGRELRDHLRKPAQGNFAPEGEFRRKRFYPQNAFCADKMGQHYTKCDGLGDTRSRGRATTPFCMGKINSQSRKILTTVLTTVAAATIRGEPSFQQKPISTLLIWRGIRNNEYQNLNSVCGQNVHISLIEK